ncbi:hypothetical protein [Paraburkholderia domus]|uniref:Uncharacterized protein n=1 Tax=Paraburkholderia domus TaxID=2793075 RepID=A0A9N8R3W1_9BURK|nr:hypothetical protein [Paraburkholderia domus]MBK5169459.1 hypothetical protein [Burkholderia sp. R-70211]CAE6959504.1 hypothetical protein R70211_06835 [Paraburkholderia domus]
MNASGPYQRSLADMTVRELAKLYLLNERLTQAEEWIRQLLKVGISIRGKDCIQTHALEFMDDAGALDTFHVQADIYCLSRTQRPSPVQEGSTIVAKLNGRGLMREADHDDPCTVSQANRTDADLLTHMRVGRIFRELHDHHLNRDWNRMLDIEGLRVEVSTMQCRLECWS